VIPRIEWLFYILVIPHPCHTAIAGLFGIPAVAKGRKPEV
jgi:hypothetical protein